MSYTELTRGERYQIYALMKTDHRKVKTTRIPSRCKSATSRELCRNKCFRGCRPAKTHCLEVVRRGSKSLQCIESATWSRVERLLIMCARLGDSFQNDQSQD